MYDFYDYIIRGNIEKDEIFKKEKIINTVLEYDNMRILANISSISSMLTFTLKLIKKELPEIKYLDMIKPSLLKESGLILVTGTSCSSKITTLNVLIDEINKNDCKKIITFENSIEYIHMPKNSIVLQRVVEKNDTLLTSLDNILKENADVVVIHELKNRQTMDKVIELLEAGHLVIASMNSHSCIDAINRIINFYSNDNQSNIRHLLSYLLNCIVYQKVIKDKNDDLILVPEIMSKNELLSINLRKEEFNLDTVKQVFQDNQDSENITLINYLAKLYLEQVIDLDTARLSIDNKDVDLLNRIIMQMRG